MVFSFEGPVASGKSWTNLTLKEKFPELTFVDFDLLKDRTFTLGDWEKWNNNVTKFGEDWRRNISYKVGILWFNEALKLNFNICTEICSSFDGLDEMINLTKSKNLKFYRILLLPPLEICISRNRLRGFKQHLVSFLDQKVKESYDFYVEKSKTENYDFVIDTHTSTAFDIIDFKKLLSS